MADKKIKLPKIVRIVSYMPVLHLAKRYEKVQDHSLCEPLHELLGRKKQQLDELLPSLLMITFCVLLLSMTRKQKKCAKKMK